MRAAGSVNNWTTDMSVGTEIPSTYHTWRVLFGIQKFSRNSDITQIAVCHTETLQPNLEIFCHRRRSSQLLSTRRDRPSIVPSRPILFWALTLLMDVTEFRYAGPSSTLFWRQNVVAADTAFGPEFVVYLTPFRRYEPLELWNLADVVSMHGRRRPLECDKLVCEEINARKMKVTWSRDGLAAKPLVTDGRADLTFDENFLLRTPKVESVAKLLSLAENWDFTLCLKNNICNFLPKFRQMSSDIQHFFHCQIYKEPVTVHDPSTW